MSGPELAGRLEPNPAKAAATIYAGAIGAGLYLDDGPRLDPDKPVLPRALSVIEPTAYIATVAIAVWGRALEH
jgi:hypothetical protein